jgi:hypothetical protein
MAERGGIRSQESALRYCARTCVMRPLIKAIMRVKFFRCGDGITQNNALKRALLSPIVPKLFLTLVIR